MSNLIATHHDNRGTIEVPSGFVYCTGHQPGGARLMEAYAPKTIQEAAVFLDRNLPGWETYINLDTLDMSSTVSCILGQLAQQQPRLYALHHGSHYYAWAVDVLHITDDYGVFSDADAEDYAEDGDPNRRKWIKAVKARLRQPPVRDLSAATDA